ncbi:MAG: DUF2924 domain-containing protein [Acidobacteriia bacterium]|nr:DUF2924 domain-containing protein [Terriglobia bacterium]
MKKRDGLPEIGDLPMMNAPQLQAAHRELFGAEHAIANCQHLRRKIAWHLQAGKDGGLPESVRQYAIAIARGTELRMRISENASRRQSGVPLDQTVTTTVVQTRDARLPMPGSLIVKKYKAQTVVVRVLNDGFEYDSRRFASLSAIAGEITGTRWNGFAFFGLEKEARHAR